MNARLRELQAALPKKPSRQEQRRKAMLAVIYDEVGEEEFARFAKLTEIAQPHLFQGEPQSEEEVAHRASIGEVLADWRSFISARPALLSLLYDIDMLPEQTVTRAGAIRLVGLCEVWKRGEEGGLLSDQPTAAMISAGDQVMEDRAYGIEPPPYLGELARDVWLAMRAAAQQQGGEHA